MWASNGMLLLERKKKRMGVRMDPCLINIG